VEKIYNVYSKRGWLLRRFSSLEEAREYAASIFTLDNGHYEPDRCYITLDGVRISIDEEEPVIVPKAFEC
jgi:hypothetical protein